MRRPSDPADPELLAYFEFDQGYGQYILDSKSGYSTLQATPVNWNVATLDLNVYVDVDANSGSLTLTYISLAAFDAQNDTILFTITSLPSYGKLYLVNGHGNVDWNEVDIISTGTHSHQVLYVSSLYSNKVDTFSYLASDARNSPSGANVVIYLIKDGASCDEVPGNALQDRIVC
jgi:hypothetical protein